MPSEVVLPSSQRLKMLMSAVSQFAAHTEFTLSESPSLHRHPNSLLLLLLHKFPVQHHAHDVVSVPAVVAATCVALRCVVSECVAREHFQIKKFCCNTK